MRKKIRQKTSLFGSQSQSLGDFALLFHSSISGIRTREWSNCLRRRNHTSKGCCGEVYIYQSYGFSSHLIQQFVLSARTNSVLPSNAVQHEDVETASCLSQGSNLGAAVRFVLRWRRGHGGDGFCVPRSCRYEAEVQEGHSS